MLQTNRLAPSYNVTNLLLSNLSVLWDCVCRAGDDTARAISLGRSAACTKSCYSGPTGDCGGELSTTVYVVGNNKPTAASAATNKAYSSLGCYKDNIADRAMPKLLKSDVGMTVDKCAALAQKAGETWVRHSSSMGCFALPVTVIQQVVVQPLVITRPCGCTADHLCHSTSAMMNER